MITNLKLTKCVEASTNNPLKNYARLGCITNVTYFIKVDTNSNIKQAASTTPSWMEKAVRTVKCILKKTRKQISSLLALQNTLINYQLFGHTYTWWQLVKVRLIGGTEDIWILQSAVMPGWYFLTIEAHHKTMKIHVTQLQWKVGQMPSYWDVPLDLLPSRNDMLIYMDWVLECLWRQNLT